MSADEPSTRAGPSSGAAAGSVHVESVGTGAPLVLLHGWAMHGGWWAPLLPDLARRFRVHVVDLPGHGHSRSAGPVTLAGIVAVLATHFAEATALPVIGWSLGAMVALAWARCAPTQVGRLLLVGATPRFVCGPDWPHGIDAAVLQRFADELEASYRLTLQRFLSLQLHGANTDRTTLAAMRQQLFARGAPDPAALVAALDILRHADLRAEVHDVSQAALLVAGDRDTLIPPGASRWLATAMPRASLRWIPGAGHVPFLSHRDAFRKTLAEFADAS
ncbi:MAG: pimeloyl-ACP methyl ester esterase BioH [Casimicrobiaceae bacterium]